VVLAPQAPALQHALAAPAAQLALPAPKKSKKSKGSPALDGPVLDVELLKRQLIKGKTELTSMERTKAGLDASNQILARRIRLYKERENDAQYAHLSTSASQAPPPASYGSVSELPSSAACSPTAGSCCSSELLLETMLSMRRFLFKVVRYEERLGRPRILYREPRPRTAAYATSALPYLTRLLNTT
jgi:hypothetical protein